ncbi:hypothetical protein [Streptosporangium sp. H16]|uniref:hypothetical protein n=1 Tax=Streptosporangium sp. H16 TaxID=3444184 RepID=UPI003F7A52E7
MPPIRDWTGRAPPPTFTEGHAGIGGEPCDAVLGRGADVAEYNGGRRRQAAGRHMLVTGN